MTLSDQLRRAIKQSGLSLNQIATETGVGQPALSRFLMDGADHRDIRLERTGDSLAEFFGLELAPKPGATARAAKVPREPQTKAGRPRGGKKEGQLNARLRGKRR